MRRIYKLHFVAPVHLGEGRLTDAGFLCRSDTLFSALFLEALARGGNVADGLLLAVRRGDLVLSDALPFIGERLYLPKPRIRVERAGERHEDVTASILKKAAKKLAYVPADAYARYLADDFDVIAESDNFARGIGASALATRVNLAGRRGLDSGAPEAESSEAEPYHVGTFRFAKAAGLYVVVDGSYDPSPLFETLQYSGLGGERSSGCGRFWFEQTEADLSVGAAGLDGHHSVLLSTALPAREELTDELLEGASYQVVRRSGFAASTAGRPLKRRDLYAFAAGSAFVRKFDGVVLDANVAGPHPVWRDLRACWLEV